MRTKHKQKLTRNELRLSSHKATYKDLSVNGDMGVDVHEETILCVARMVDWQSLN